MEPLGPLIFEVSERILPSPKQCNIEIPPEASALGQVRDSAIPGSFRLLTKTQTNRPPSSTPLPTPAARPPPTLISSPCLGKPLQSPSPSSLAPPLPPEAQKGRVFPRGFSGIILRLQDSARKVATQLVEACAKGASAVSAAVAARADLIAAAEAAIGDGEVDVLIEGLDTGKPTLRLVVLGQGEAASLTGLRPIPLGRGGEERGVAEEGWGGLHPCTTRR